MPDEQAPQSLRQPWTPERIQQYMRDEHGVNWAPPTIESTWKEEQAQTVPLGDAADEWTVYDPTTHELRVLSSGELFDLTDAVKRSEPVGLDDAPRDHLRTERESIYLQDAMKTNGVSAETRAQVRWETRMNPDQARAQSMARHPSGKQIQPLRPAIS